MLRPVLDDAGRAATRGEADVVSERALGPGQDGYLTMLRRAYGAGHITRTEWLERLEQHRLYGEIAEWRERLSGAAG